MMVFYTNPRQVLNDYRNYIVCLFMILGMINPISASEFSSKVSIGPINNEMSFEEIIDTLGGGEIDCVKWTDDIIWACNLTFKDGKQKITVRKTPDGRTFQIVRTIKIPDNISTYNVFRQIAEKYKYLGKNYVVKNRGARAYMKFMQLGCLGDGKEERCQITASIYGKEISFLDVYFRDIEATEDNDARIKVEEEKIIPKIPL